MARTKRDNAAMTETPLAPLDADLRRLYESWNELRGTRMAPSRAELDPMALRYILGNLLLVDVLRDPLRFRYRLCGTNIVARAGFDLTGRFVDEHPEPQYRDFALARYREVVELAAPLHGVRDEVLDQRFRRYEVLLLPLSSDGMNVDMVLVAMKYLT
jgi:hypothetical protein